MVTTDNTNKENIQEQTQDAEAVDAVATCLDNVTLQPNQEQDLAPAGPHSIPPVLRQCLVYTRKQILRLSRSPLVKPPDGMPAFKSWFGELNEQALQSNKKEVETTNTNGTGRDRRYRREAEDGDAPARPAFRSTLSQPSQMGNFKHQPLRGGDRDRDRDTERDLRTLSDKYDRERSRNDRLGLPTHSTLLRNRDRESAPHLAQDREAQRPTTRKRNGESSEDWRRGAEPPRAGRDENHPRREREERERPRSGAREGSRHRDSPPSTRRDRDDRDRERTERRDRERDDHRQNHERDRERFNETDDDPRRWRDDGKREERVASRRGGERFDRDRDGGDRESWGTADDRDTRGQKRGTRDRRLDDGRDKEDRKEREKEKEPAWMETYVPSPSTSGGILGGKGVEGEVDSIQAWKKDMKEREMKAKGLISESPTVDSPAAAAAQDSREEAAQLKTPTVPAEGQLDEIQLFKLMIKKEEQKRAVSGEVLSPVNERPHPSSGSVHSVEDSIPGLSGIREGRAAAPLANAQHSQTPPMSSSEAARKTEPSQFHPSKLGSAPKIPNTEVVIASSSPGAVLLGPGSNLMNTPNASSQIATGPTASKMDSMGPRLLSSKLPEPISVQGENQVPLTRDNSSPSMPFDPPRQSRLLAFGARDAKPNSGVLPTSQAGANAAQTAHVPQQSVDPLWPNQRRPSASPVFSTNMSQQDRLGISHHIPTGPYDTNIAISNLDNSRRHGRESVGSQHDFLSLENASRLAHAMDGSMEPTHTQYGPDSTRPSSGAHTIALDRVAAVERGVGAVIDGIDIRGRNPTPPVGGFGATSPISPFDAQMGGGQSTYSTGKGSRMAKHFEKARDPQAPTMTRAQNMSSNPNIMLPGRQDAQGFNNQNESRNLSDLLTMLNNSAQAQRGHHVHPGLNQNLISQQPSQNMHIGRTGSVGRRDSLMDPEEGRFAPDGLVPGLRPTTAATRNRDIANGPIFNGQLDDVMQFNARLAAQQRGSIDQLFPGSISPQFNGQNPSGGRGIPGFQQQPIRGGPSPINNFNPMQVQPQQRLPPGLANLGGRPPHEPSQFLGGGAGNYGVPSQTLHGGMHSNNPQPFNQFQNPNINISGTQGQLRGQPGLGQLANPMTNGLNGLEFRGGPNGLQQNQLLGLGGPGVGSVMRGGPAYNPQQLHGPPQLPPSLGLRQQNNLPPPHLMQQMLPPQIQQHGLAGTQHNSNDLMALLMGGVHRE